MSDADIYADPSYPPLHWKQAWKQVADSEDETLHRISRIDGPLFDDDPTMYPTQLIGESACGASGGWVMPGMLSRMHAPRCAACCAALGVEEGAGIPGNGKALDGTLIAAPDRWVGEEYYGVGPDAPPSEATEDE